MNNQISSVIILYVIQFLYFTLAYKPVILLHGIMTGYETMELIKSRIQEVSTYLL